MKKTNNQILENVYDYGMKLAYEGKYKEAITVLLPLARDNYLQSRNNIGVCFQRIGDYINAAKFYRISEDDTARVNLGQLYTNKQIKFDRGDFFKIAQELMQAKNQEGYHLMYEYYSLTRFVETDYKKGFDYILKGLLDCGASDTLIFDLGVCYEFGYGVEKDEVRAHMYYGMILENDKVGQYNYALQCYQGRGCEKDVERAIFYFEKSAKQNYKDAIEHLIEIYQSEEYKNEEKYLFYKKQLERINENCNIKK